MKIKRIATFMLCLALLFVMGGECLLSPFLVKADANSNKYTDVLEDLKLDATFNENDYPPIANDTTLKVIQIAESENQELFLYVYQPGNITEHRKASKINMSLQNPLDNTVTEIRKFYDLEWIDNNGVFDKYVVKNLTVSSAPYRYYNIIGIYRPFDSDVDDESVAIDRVNLKSFPVGLSFIAYRFNNALKYECRKLDVALVKIHASGSIRYSDGWQWSHIFTLPNTDSFYVAFSIDNYDVNYIYDGHISFDEFKYYQFHGLLGDDDPVLSDTIHYEDVKISEGDVGQNNGTGGWFGKTYKWDRIQTVEKFITEATDDANESFSKEEQDALKNSQYVFRFYEAEYKTQYVDGISNYKYYSEIDNFSFLSLKFATPEGIYDLGCVSDFVGIDSNPELDVDALDNLINNIEDQDWWIKMMMVLLAIAFLLLMNNLWMPIKLVFRVFINGLVFLVKLFLWIIVFPFRSLRAIVARKKL